MSMRDLLTKLSTVSRRRAPFVALLLVASLQSVAFAERRERRIEGWRPVHYEVRLAFDAGLSEVKRAETEITVLILRDGVGVVDLDFGEMPLDGVSVGGRPARYERPPGRLNVSLPRAARRGERFAVTVSYHGRPKDGLILTKDKDGNPSATGDNWPDRVHHWIPSLDHPSAKASVTFMITTPGDMVAVANGRLVGTGSGTRDSEWLYVEPHAIPPYCMIVAVARDEVIESRAPASRRIAPLLYYVAPSERAFAEKGFAAAPPSLELFSRLVAPYPYEKLAHIVGATRFGGMENSGAIVYASTLFDARPNEPLSARFGIRRGLVEVVAHETAHQWFGDSVSPATWADLWLSEGFATYFAGLLVERYEGAAAFRDYMSRAANAYLLYEKTRRAPIHDRETEDLNKLLNANNYQKGAWVLHTLRARLGDPAFFRGIRLYYNAHKDGNATTEDLRAALERASGRNLREFFARWIYASGHPVYQASWKWRGGAGRGGGGVATLTLAQAQEGEPFLTAVPVEIVAEGGVLRRLLVRPTGRETSVIVPLARRPVEVRVDPGATILKEVLSAPVRKAVAASR
ncbi:MAG TPA: M1 family aminopeptidase [Pyrinomonadaceae bacterium]|jgi:aminopeptidase N|nr:M1 family aminopeptidase [Pyrinomonadaceae bacterium]